MRICFVADGRSPIAHGWIRNVIEQGHDVHLVSTYPCDPNVLPGAQVHQIPVAFSYLLPTRPTGTDGAVLGRPRPSRHDLLARLRGHGLGAQVGRTADAARMWLSPLEVRLHVRRMRAVIREIAPDVVHALRVPFEGIVAARATPPDVPLVISIWGNDLTRFAAGNALIRRETRTALRRADGLFTDCRRDEGLAFAFGLAPGTPTSVLPGGGGIDRRVFVPCAADPASRAGFELPEGARVVVNPRGWRPYVCTGAFFRAIPAVLEQVPDAMFLCCALAGVPAVEQSVTQLGIGDRVRLLPGLSLERMADLFRLAEVTVSPSVHDGTPNTLLEAMACGCFPVAGDIDSVQEWIANGVNGLLCDPTDPAALTASILRALGDHPLRETAATRNLDLIRERADRHMVKGLADAFYGDVRRS